MESTVFKEEIQWQQIQAKWPTSLAVRQMKIKTAFPFPLTPVRMTITNKQAKTNRRGKQILAKVLGKEEPFYTAIGGVNLCSHSGN